MSDNQQKIELWGHDLTNREVMASLSDEELWNMRAWAYNLSGNHCTLQVTYKTVRNSMYGATSNKHYAFANIEVAEDITAEGRNAIHLGEARTNKYFVEEWHLDHELHQKLFEDERLKGKFDPDIVSGVKQIEQLPDRDYILYIDTDSIYIDFEDCLRSIGFDLSQNWWDVILAIQDYRFAGMYDNLFETHVSNRHGQSVLKFDFETIADTAIFISKKHYVQTIQWADGRLYEDPLQHIKGKGIELIQNNASPLVKQMLSYGYQQVLGNKIKSTIDYRKMIRKLWKRFEQEDDIQNLSQYVNCGKYFEYIKADKTEIRWEPRTLPQYRGIALHNYLINKCKLLQWYQPIRNGRVYWYLIDKNKTTLDASVCPYEVDAFSYNPEELPKEFVEKGWIPIDKWGMFAKMVLAPLQRIAMFMDGVDTSDPLKQFETPSLLF